MTTCDFKDIHLIIDYLKNDKVVLMETDTLLGLYSKNQDLLYKLKNRSKEKKIVLFVKDISEIDKNPSKELILLSNAFWPGKLTIIYNNIAYRIPNKKEILNILNLVSPIYCTSANISGQEAIRNSDEALQIFKNNSISDQLLIVNGQSYSKLGSTIYNLDTHKLIRQGEITIHEINSILKR